MGRKSTNNPRQIRSKTCGCKLCLERYPGDRPPEKECTGTWQARYTPPGKKERTRNFPDSDSAVAFLEKMRTQIRERTWIDPKRAEITLADWHEMWWPKQRGEENTLDRDHRMWRLHISPQFGAWKLFEIGYLDIQGWVNSLEGPLGPASITKAFQVLDRMLETARLDRRIPFNPAEGVKLPRLKKKHPEDRKPPTYAEMWRIRACLPEYHHTLQIVAQETGLRWGELAGLRACWVDLEGQRLQVREVMVEVRGKLRRKIYPKSDAGLRTVPLTPLACRVLRDHLAKEQPSTRKSAPEDGMCEDELVFHGRNRRKRGTLEPYRAPLRRSAFRRLWIKAIQDAGVARSTVRKWKQEEENPETGRMRTVEKERTDWWPDFHDQRHALASRLHNLGVPEAVVQELLGHERAGEVTWLYTHAANDVAGQVLAAFADRWADKPNKRRLKAVA